ncbi:MAG TPA: GntR family transcriptional regulator [Tepidisphaeraceae bacterium]|jgi:GntR family transcriptional regulator
MSRGRQSLILDRSSSDPLHLQIERLLRRMVSDPEYRNGKRFPTEPTLAKELKVSRNTVRAAMSRLESEGLLERKPRVGTRVAPARPHVSLAEWYSFSGEMRRQGIEVRDFELAISREPAEAEGAAGLGIDEGTPVWLLHRVRGWEDVPAVVSDSWLHPSVELTGSEDFRRPLYQVIGEAGGAAPAVSREEISAAAAGARIAKALRVAKSEPVLVRKRVILDAHGKPIEFNVNYYRTDRYTLTLDLARPAGDRETR